ncbi:MAG: low specificity L-threonine aldolase [SAR202 cluster bacterium]|nr:hypothetical protein [Chloroflexota bacterium]MQG88225.1 low specificity L-threonine aldolase [SAR202 cluster bacterium]|tara:strand:- start:740 stop:1873 length:1134 start_codon:yes stop_codon:yes gene_type:complete
MPNQLTSSSGHSHTFDPKADPNSVVFVGDGEPHTPEATIARLSKLLKQGKLIPDHYSLGGSVADLESRMADELGKEAAIWMPTGTMANIIGLRKHCGINARVVLQEQSHIYQDEGDALSRLCSINAVPLALNRPHFTVDELKESFKASTTGRVLNPVGAVSVESPVRRQAGQVVPWDDMVAVTELCRKEGIPVHLDGARLYMMSAVTGISVRKYASMFDSVYVSSYKYFGAPFGGVLAGKAEFVDGLFNDRRMFGGGIPFGYLAAGLSLEGIDDFEVKFDKSLAKAKNLFEGLDEISGIYVRKFKNGSNIFELQLDDSIDAEKFTESLLQASIVLNWPSSEWPRPLLHVNSSILRLPNSEIIQAFSDAYQRSRKDVS